jgi:hypothetical protein
MANEKLEPELEYKLPEESAAVKEITDAHGIAPLPKSKTSPGKRILIPIILILAIVLLYRGINWYSQHAEQARQKQAEAVAVKSAESAATTAETMPVQQVQASAVVPGAQAPIAPRGADELSTQQKLDILASRTENNTERLDSLKRSLDETQSAIVNLNKTIGELSIFTKDLTANLQQVIVDQGKGHATKQVRRRSTSSKMVYYKVKAIVPGMAWLESSEGQTVAVRVGSRLGRYGKVRLISPKQGMVVTSYGSIIQYGTNDF